MDGSTVGYGAGEATDDWGKEYGSESEHNGRVGDTCYWRDRDGPPGEGDPADCSHSFRPEGAAAAPNLTQSSTTTTASTE
mmetsp:Transcript_18788/g.49539  ORF Transcript_18788/g.49539 Transcript_18788/m.49539 type:complete len:80 (+) Transcript_18788:223-462(+)